MTNSENRLSDRRGNDRRLNSKPIDFNCRRKDNRRMNKDRRG